MLTVSNCVESNKYVPLKKIDGRTHSRKDELSTYRRSIAEANSKMHQAADKGDIELAMFWSGRIDEAQSKIFAIIEQEDKHSYKKADVASAGVKTAIDTADKMVNTAIKATGAVAGSKLSLSA